MDDDELSEAGDKFDSERVSEAPAVPSATASAKKRGRPIFSKLTNRMKAGLAFVTEKGSAVIDSAAKVVAQGASQAKKATSEFINSKKTARAITQRKANGIVSVNDALLRIQGWYMPEIPSLKRQWYIELYPQVTPDASHGDEIKAPSYLQAELASRKRYGDSPLKTQAYRAEPTNAAPYTAATDETSAQFGFDTKCAEIAKSEVIHSFTSDSFYNFNSYLHLADVSRYSSIGIVMYMEVLDVDLTDSISMAVDHMSFKDAFSANRNPSKYTEDSKRKFTAAFVGKLNFNYGSIFNPCGSRVNFILEPNPSIMNELPRAQELWDTRGLRMLLTYMPVAIPSTAYLQTFRNMKRPNVCYPSSLVDGEALGPCSVDWETSFGTLLYVCAFRDRMLIACKSNHCKDPKEALQLVEYNSEGDFVGSTKDIYHKEFGDKILTIITGHRHVCCCSNNGMIFVQQVSAELQKETQKEEEVEEEQPQDERDNKRGEKAAEKTGIKRWAPGSVYSQAHPKKSAIIGGCVLNHADMDIFFTLDRNGNIGVQFISRGGLLRSFFNHAFLSTRAVALCVFEVTLYIATLGGTVVSVDLSDILHSDINGAGSLSDFVIADEVVFPADSGGIHSMAICCANSFVGISNEDTLIKRNFQRRAAAKQAEKNRGGSGRGRTAPDAYMGSNEDYYETDEQREYAEKYEDTVLSAQQGHMLIVGGGDETPVLKLLLPHKVLGIREVDALRGHTHAITHISVDAAGRYIFSGSTGEKAILMWDTLSGSCERRFEGVNVGTMAVGMQFLVVGSFRSPYIRMWNVKMEDRMNAANNPNLLSKLRVNSKSRNKFEEELEKLEDGLVEGPYSLVDGSTYTAEGSNAGDPFVYLVADTLITTVRSPRWCLAMLKPMSMGDLANLNKGIGRGRIGQLFSGGGSISGGGGGGRSVVSSSSDDNGSVDGGDGGGSVANGSSYGGMGLMDSILYAVNNTTPKAIMRAPYMEAESATVVRSWLTYYERIDSWQEKGLLQTTPGGREEALSATVVASGADSDLIALSGVGMGVQEKKKDKGSGSAMSSAGGIAAAMEPYYLHQRGRGRDCQEKEQKLLAVKNRASVSNGRIIRSRSPSPSSRRTNAVSSTGGGGTGIGSTSALNFQSVRSRSPAAADRRRAQSRLEVVQLDKEVSKGLLNIFVAGSSSPSPTTASSPAGKPPKQLLLQEGKTHGGEEESQYDSDDSKQRHKRYLEQKAKQRSRRHFSDSSDSSYEDDDGSSDGSSVDENENTHSYSYSSVAKKSNKNTSETKKRLLDLETKNDENKVRGIRREHNGVVYFHRPTNGDVAKSGRLKKKVANGSNGIGTGHHHQGAVAVAVAGSDPLELPSGTRRRDAHADKKTASRMRAMIHVRQSRLRPHGVKHLNDQSDDDDDDDGD